MKEQIIDIIEDFEDRMSNGFGYYCNNKSSMLSELADKIIQQFIPVVSTKDDSGHLYIIPNELAKEFNDLCYEEDKYKEFEDKFSKYKTGGSLSNYQLYILQEELKRLTNE